MPDLYLGAFTIQQITTLVMGYFSKNLSLACWKSCGSKNILENLVGVSAVQLPKVCTCVCVVGSYALVWMSICAYLIVDIQYWHLLCILSLRSVDS